MKVEVMKVEVTQVEAVTSVEEDEGKREPVILADIYIYIY
jgi:hypothetical protein